MPDENRITRRCPHCGNNHLAAKIIRLGVVEVVDKGEGNSPDFIIIGEKKDTAEIEVCYCNNCKTEITADQLVVGVPCKKCGNMVPSDDLDENGVCSLCAALAERTELANASKDDILRMLLEAEKKAKAMEGKIAEIEKKEKAAATKPKRVRKPKNADSDASKAIVSQMPMPDILVPDTSNAAPAEPQEPVAEAPVAEENSQTVDELAEAQALIDEVNNMSNSQEAPFPDIQQDSFEQPQNDLSQPFSMYDDTTGDAPF